VPMVIDVKLEATWVPLQSVGLNNGGMFRCASFALGGIKLETFMSSP